MDLSKYDEKHVRVRDIYGETHTGVADYYPSEYCRDEFGEEEDAIRIEGFYTFESQVASIEEIAVHGTAELRTERLILRRYRPEDAEDLYRYLGTDPESARYSGWNPYATPEMARETVRRYIAGYGEEHFYSWVMDWEDVLVGTIGAYDAEDGRIEAGFSVVRGWQGRGLATEALKKVLEYLTENEGFSRVTAWCAAENTGSRRVLEKAGMKLVNIEKDGLAVGDRTYDRMNCEYRKGNDTMFTADMIAPCGLDCSLCAMALKKTDPCPGCSGPDENKPDFCANRCGIILCRKRKENGYRFCDECPDYPCGDVMEKENRYTSKYPLRESPLENLRRIREAGMEAFLEQERRTWTCGQCGSPVSVHTGICSGCGRKTGRNEDK